MAKAKVFFAEARISSTAIPRVTPEQWYRHSLVHKMERVFDEALGGVVSPGDLVAVKIHLGERYSHGYIRPIYVRRLVEKLKDLGAKPFVTDTLLSGYEQKSPWMRRQLEGALQTAAMNGFTSETVGAPIIIADAPKGLKSVEVEINGKELKRAYLAPAIAEADALIGFAHFKGHDVVGMGGAIKNLGVGGQTKIGKYWIHRQAKPKVVESKCNGCGECLPVCPLGAITLIEGKASIDSGACLPCGFCLEFCDQGALYAPFTAIPDQIENRVGEAASALLKHIGREKCGFINLAVDITPLCDCDPFLGIPFVPDIGVLASRDSVALDRACCDLVTAMPGVPGSMAEEAEVMAPGVEKLNAIARLRWLATPGAENCRPDWRIMLKAAENLGIGTQDYELIKVTP